MALPLSPEQCQPGAAGYHLSMTDPAVLVVDTMNSYQHPHWRQPPRSFDLHVLLRVFPIPDPSLVDI